MRESDHELPAGGKRIDNRLLLIHCLHHGGRSSVQQISVFIELDAMGNCGDLYCSIMHQSQNDPIASQLRRDFGHQGIARIFEIPALQDYCHQLQDEPHPQTGCFHGVSIASQQNFLPARSPLKLPHRYLQLKFIAPCDIQANNPSYLAIQPDRIGELEIRTIRRLRIVR